MKSGLIIGVLVAIFFISCRESGNNASGQVTPRDTSINDSTSYSEMFFDSTQMEAFISRQHFHDSLEKRLRNFYNGRNYQFAWFFKEGMAEYTSAFYNTYNDFINYAQEPDLKNKMLQNLYDSIANENFIYNSNDSIVLNTEILLTAQFFRYARRAYQGNNQLNVRELSWFIPRKKIDPTALLDSLLANRGENFSAYEPVNQQYHLLKDHLLKYYQIEKKGGWPQLKAEKKSYKLNDVSPLIGKIKQHLFLTGDFASRDSSDLFTPELEQAVRSVESRFGFNEDGVITATLINELNKPIRERLRQILINMERIRWMPAQPNTDYLLVNIPEFKLHVYEKGEFRWNTNVVVGKEATHTVIFTSMLRQIVFSPYWNVPSSILRKEILPAIARNKNYLARNHMEWYGGGVRQKPGPDNALGLIKFLFPNNYNIYLHDTPSKSLFSQEKRTFSHGCIRVQEPQKLAQFILRNEPAWDSLKITQAMNAGKERFYTIKNSIPVYVGYFTAWVDREGKLNFRNDIYGHDKRMIEKLFKK